MVHNVKKFKEKGYTLVDNQNDIGNSMETSTILPMECYLHSYEVLWQKYANQKHLKTFLKEISPNLLEETVI